jgi:hypothetical protein
VLPAIPGFLASLRFEEGELADVAYEPSENTYRWPELASRLGEVRMLRRAVANAARFGVFRLEGDEAFTMAKRMQLAKGVDPSMAIYAAYAYDSLERRRLLRSMESYLRLDLDLRLFDISLLSGELDGLQVGALEDVFPFCPMLAQGWALLSAHRVTISLGLENIQRYLLPSLWTLFNATGTRLLRAAMARTEVH